MENGQHQFCQLFKQLGLLADKQSIERFIVSHRLLPADMNLADAPFWDDAQRALLKQAHADDADWSALVDQLNLRLR